MFNCVGIVWTICTYCKQRFLFDLQSQCFNSIKDVMNTENDCGSAAHENSTLSVAEAPSPGLITAPPAIGPVRLGENPSIILLPDGAVAIQVTGVKHQDGKLIFDPGRVRALPARPYGAWEKLPQGRCFKKNDREVYNIYKRIKAGDSIDVLMADTKYSRHAIQQIRCRQWRDLRAFGVHRRGEPEMTERQRQDYLRRCGKADPLTEAERRQMPA